MNPKEWRGRPKTANKVQMVSPDLDSNEKTQTGNDPTM